MFIDSSCPQNLVFKFHFMDNIMKWLCVCVCVCVCVCWSSCLCVIKFDGL